MDLDIFIRRKIKWISKLNLTNMDLDKTSRVTVVCSTKTVKSNQYGFRLQIYNKHFAYSFKLNLTNMDLDF